MKRLLLAVSLFAGAAPALTDAVPAAAKPGADTSRPNRAAVVGDKPALKIDAVRTELGVRSEVPLAEPKPSSLPELQTLGLMGLGLLAIGFVTRRRLMD